MTEPEALATELRVLIGKLSRRLREQARTGDLTGSQSAVLIRLERDGPATVTALAKAEFMRPQSMGANVAALETAGLVAGAPDPEDGRQTIWSLTETCREWIKTSRAAKRDWLLHAIQSSLTPEQQEQLPNAIALLKRLIP